MTPRSFVPFVPSIAEIEAPSAARPRQTMIYPLVLTYPLIPLHTAHREPVSGLSSKVQSRSAHYFIAINTAEAFFLTHGSVHHNSMLIKIQPDATICRYLFTAKSLYMFRVSQHVGGK